MVMTIRVKNVALTDNVVIDDAYSSLSAVYEAREYFTAEQKTQFLKKYDDLMELARGLMNTNNMVLFARAKDNRVMLFEMYRKHDGKRLSPKEITEESENFLIITVDDLDI